MPEQPPNIPPGGDFSRSVGEQEKRRLRAGRTRAHVWSGLGMFGLIGWSIGVPTLLGILLGRWIDSKHAGPRSWTLILLSVGLSIGCANAWHWITKEENAIHKERDSE